WGGDRADERSGLHGADGTLRPRAAGTLERRYRRRLTSVRNCGQRVLAHRVDQEVGDIAGEGRADQQAVGRRLVDLPDHSLTARENGLGALPGPEGAGMQVEAASL